MLYICEAFSVIPRLSLFSIDGDFCSAMQAPDAKFSRSERSSGFSGASKPLRPRPSTPTNSATLTLTLDSYLYFIILELLPEGKHLYGNLGRTDLAPNTDAGNQGLRSCIAQMEFLPCTLEQLSGLATLRATVL